MKTNDDGTVTMERAELERMLADACDAGWCGGENFLSSYEDDVARSVAREEADPYDIEVARELLRRAEEGASA